MDTGLKIEVFPDFTQDRIYDFDKEIYDLDCQINMLSSNADTLDCLLAAASGLACSMLDILWVGEFDLTRGRSFSNEKAEQFVQRIAHMLGCPKDDLKGCVEFLEGKYLIPSDGNMANFGGTLQHHLRDFAHHPTIVGLAFSLLTQFTGKSYGTDVNGTFLIVDVPEKSKVFIGQDNSSKIINGTLIWFFHLVSDLAGSKKTAGLSGGTGIPGPILSLAKELSVLPVFKNTKVGKYSPSLFLSKLFNGTLLAKHDENGKIIKDTVLKMDLRGELGISTELGRQALPVIANEAIVRTLYFIRRLGMEIRRTIPTSFDDFKEIDSRVVMPANSPTLTRMLTIATGLFTMVDLANAVITQKYWVAVNYVGVARFAFAISGEIVWAMKRQDIKAIRSLYEKLKQNTFQASDNRIYGRIQSDMNIDRMGLTLEQTEILYNLEYHKTKHDIDVSKLPVGSEKYKALKLEWLKEWSEYMSAGFGEFVQIKDAVLHWYSEEDLKKRISQMSPSETWFKLALLEAMLFEPYFPLGTEQTKKGKEVPSKKYNSLNAPVIGFNEKQGDKYLEQEFTSAFCTVGLISRFRKCHSKALKQLNEVMKTALTALTVGAGVIIVTVITAGAFAPQIAVALVGSHFAGLSGAALTNACLAYLGGGAIAMGGTGMAGGTIAVVGGGAILGAGVGVGAGGITAAVGLGGKETTIMQSAKLIVSVQEIFLNEEKDRAYSSSVYQKYVNSIMEIEKDLVELRLKADVASKEEKKTLKEKIRNAEESVEAMKIAMKSINKLIDSYKEDLNQTE